MVPRLWFALATTTNGTLPGPGGKGGVVYVDIAGGHFQCTYAEEKCTDPTAAEAICRSMRPKAGK